MKKILLVVAVMIVLATTPAYAQSGCERAHECGESVAWANPMEDPKDLVYVWDPIFGQAHETGSYGLVLFCQQYGGYYYTGSDGAWYWFAC